MTPNAEQGTMLALMETQNLLGDLPTALNRLERIILMLGNESATSARSMKKP